MYFPVMCVDDFFNNPNKVREFALSLEYNSAKNSTGVWPGKRTKNLAYENFDFYKGVIEKIFSPYFNGHTTINNITTNVEMFFQITNHKECGHINEGWIHYDENVVYAGIIYLNENASLNSGTSLYRAKNFATVDNNTNSSAKVEQYLNFSEDNLSYYKTELDKNNSKFEETIRFNNVYNRLIAFDGKTYHGVRNYYEENSIEDRLTLVFFVNNILSNWFPFPEIKRRHI